MIRAIAAVSAVALTFTQPAYCAEAAEAGSFLSGYVVTGGGTLAMAPKFEGSDDLAMRGAPSISWRRSDEPATFSAPDDNLSFEALQLGPIGVGPVVALQPGRSSGSNNSRLGLKSLPWTIEGGMFLETWAIPDVLRLRAEVRHGFDGDSGWVADFSSDWVAKYGRYTFSAGPRISLADRAQMQREFGIAADEAGISALFAADGGLKSYGALVSIGYEWSPAWSTTLYSKVDRLAGSADRSPVTEAGQDDQFETGIEIGYSFTTP